MNHQNRTWLVTALLITIFLIKGNCQIRVEVIRHSRLSLSDSSIFISGTFNNWSPGDENYKMTRGVDGIYYFDLPDSLAYFEYKFTQGSWALVEGNGDGRVRANRVYSRNIEKNPKRIQAVIEGWETQPSYVMIVNRVPGNTPHDAGIYIMGNFNNWNPGDRNYKLIRQVDGTYRILIYSSYPQIQFKFTRGNLSSVESRPGGRMLPNRVVTRDMVKANSDVEVEIASWLDIPNPIHLYSIYDLLLLFSFFQGVLLMITMPSIQGYNVSANRWLLILIGFTSAILLVKVISSSPLVEQVTPKLQLLPDFIFFIYAPLFYLYIQRLLFQLQSKASAINKFLFIPAFIQFFVYMTYFLTDASSFESKIAYSHSDLYLVRFCFGCAALVFNFYYWLASNRALRSYKENYENSNSYEQNLQYLSTVLFIQAICLCAWGATAITAIVSSLLGQDLFNFIEFSIETIWIIFSMITFFLGYFAIHEPDLFRVSEVVQILPAAALSISTGSGSVKLDAPGRDDEAIENLEVEMERVTAYMDAQKPYTNSKLNLVELSHHLKLPPYLLSKVINVGFKRNFFDFVNGYRVEEFKRRVEDVQFRHYSLLSIAFEVGFNSKTAFNRSFKKMTNQTPSSYFNNRREY
ncbi:MAG TPA: helix-turn-helix domain-containing protein [Cyclobacteriaceae bacterium]|nr:helix-turn-helix domain-containing protein [Cyclobacteriaceae bacterium]